MNATRDPRPAVAIIMGSRSDWPTMRKATEPLNDLGIRWSAEVISCHRTPDRLYQFARTAREEGISIVIAGAAGAAHLPGMAASLCSLPVVGVPVQSAMLSGWDSLLSIAQMPGGVPVATMAVGEAGARNAGLLAARMLSISDADLARRLDSWIERQAESVPRSVE